MVEFKYAITCSLLDIKRVKEAIKDLQEAKASQDEVEAYLTKFVPMVAEDIGEYFKRLSHIFYNSMVGIAIKGIDLEYKGELNHVIFCMPYIPCNSVPDAEVISLLKEYDCGAIVLDAETQEIIIKAHE